MQKINGFYQLVRAQSHFFDQAKKCPLNRGWTAFSLGFIIFIFSYALLESFKAMKCLYYHANLKSTFFSSN